MKGIKFSYLLFLYMVFSLNAYPSSINISRNKAWEIVKTQILLGDTSKVNVYISKNIYEANTTIKAYIKDEKSPDFPSWFFLIDDHPKDSWDHPCRYVFVNTENGKFVIRNNTRPPLFDNMTILVRQTDAISKIITKERIANRTSGYAQNSAANDYAVIISGGINITNNKPRYWNNCSELYSTLINFYGYKRSHIYVIMADGTNPANDMMIGDTGVSQNLDLDGDGTNDIQYAATKQNITNVFNSLHNIISSSDNLFVFVTDHGGYDVSSGESYMYLWGTEEMSSSEFATEINKINAANINICLTQCHSGGFISNLQANNRVITTSCRYDEQAWGDDFYGTFVYPWIWALAGEIVYGATVNADTDNDGIITIQEAFNYASDYDICGPLSNNVNIEHPQYSSTPSILGRTLSLHNSFKGTYYNGTSTHDIIMPYPLYTGYGGYVEIHSPNIKDATVTYQGTTPTYWSCNTTTGYLRVRLPSTGGSVIVRIQRNGVDYYLPILATTNPYILSIGVDNGMIEVQLLSEENERNLPEEEIAFSQSSYSDLAWKIEVYNGTTGEKVFSQDISGTSYSIDTTGWKPGIYIVRAIIGDIILNEKIIVK